MTDDRWYNELSEEDREDLMEAAVVVRGDASVQAAGRKAAKLGRSEWCALTHLERMAILRKTNLTRLTTALASIQKRHLDRTTVIDELYKATVSTYVDMVLELDPNVLTFSSSPTLRRSGVRAELTSNRSGQTKTGFIPSHHLKMQGGHHPDSTETYPRGKYGKDHFPQIDEFPKSSMMPISDVAKEFAKRNTNLTLSTEEEIAWLYHRIRALLKRFIKTGANTKKYEASALGKAKHDRRRQKLPLARSMIPQENVDSRGGATPQTGTDRSRRSSSCPPHPAPRGEPSASTQASVTSKAPAEAGQKRTDDNLAEVSDDDHDAISRSSVGSRTALQRWLDTESSPDDDPDSVEEQDEKSECDMEVRSLVLRV